MPCDTMGICQVGALLKVARESEEMTESEIKKRQSQLRVEQEQLREAARNLRRGEYERRRKEEQVAKEKHKAELADEHGLTGHPKLDLLYDIAWDMGHAYGFNEVGIHFQQMAKLLK